MDEGMGFSENTPFDLVLVTVKSPHPQRLSPHGKRPSGDYRYQMEETELTLFLV